MAVLCISRGMTSDRISWRCKLWVIKLGWKGFGEVEYGGRFLGFVYQMRAHRQVSLSSLTLSDNILGHQNGLLANVFYLVSGKPLPCKDLIHDVPSKILGLCYAS